MTLPELPIDDVTLREIVDDPAPLRARLEALDGEASPAGLVERTDVLRLLDRLDEAEDAGRRAVEAAEAGGDPHDIARARLSLGRVLHRSERYAEAEQEFAVALSEAAQLGDEDLRASAVQARGTCRFDEGRTADAERDFTAALQIRRRIGAPARDIASAEQAVTAAMRRLVTEAAQA